MALRLEQVKVQRKISLQLFIPKSTEESWESSDAAIKLNEQKEAFSLQHRLVSKQSQRLEHGPEDPIRLEAQNGATFVRLYVISLKGLGIKMLGTERDSSV